MTTTTVFSDASDGLVETGPSTTYATSADGTGTISVFTTRADNNHVGQLLSGSDYYAEESFLGFDTSALPDSDIVRNVDLGLYGSSAAPAQAFVGQARAYDWDITVTAADFRTRAQLIALPLLATYSVSTAAWSTTGYNVFSENGAFASYVSKTGFTRMVLNSDRHAAGTVPTASEYSSFFMADEGGAGTTKDPKLVITHDAAYGTLTVFGDAADGGIRSNNATYATARSGGTFVVSTTSVAEYVGQRLAGDYYLYEVFLGFDTAALPDAATVSAATLSLYGFLDESTTGFTIEARADDWGVAVTSADWIAGASLSGLTSLATFATSGWSLTGYNDFTSTGSFPAAVSKTGFTRLLLDSDRTVAGTAPSGAERVAPYTADQSGTVNDPKLVVTWTQSPSTGVLIAYGDSGDGRISSTNATYSTARAAGTLLTADDQYFLIGQQTGFILFEATLGFDTSAIPDEANVAAAELALYGITDQSLTDFTAEIRISDWGLLTTNADWVAGASLGALTRVATLASTAMVTGAYNVWTQDGSNLVSSVSKTGFTRYIGASDRLVAGTQPTQDEYMTFSASDEAGSSQDPRLTVTFQAPASATSADRRTLMGVG